MRFRNKYFKLGCFIMVLNTGQEVSASGQDNLDNYVLSSKIKARCQRKPDKVVFKIFYSH